MVKAGVVLEKIIPYLITKKERAEIGLLVRRYARPRGSRGKDQNFDRVVALYDHMKVLNQRGIQDLH